MTHPHQLGPAAQRIQNFVQFFQERNLSLTLLTRKTSLTAHAPFGETALLWQDFQQIITNARQVLPPHEFDQAAAIFWHQTLNRFWIDLAQSQRRPFGTLIDLVGEAGFLFEDMPIQIQVKQHDHQRLWINARSSTESTTNIALSYLIAAEIKSFAALTGLPHLSVDITLRPKGFDLHCINRGLGRPFFTRILRSMGRRPTPRLQATLDSLRRSAAQLRGTVFELRQKDNKTERLLQDQKRHTMAAFKALSLPHFVIAPDQSIVTHQGLGSIPHCPLRPFSTLKAFFEQLDPKTQQTCADLIDAAGRHQPEACQINLTLPGTQAMPLTLMLYPNLETEHIDAFLVSERPATNEYFDDPEPINARASIDTISQEGFCITTSSDIIVWANPKFFSLLGYTRNQMLGMPFSQFIPPSLSDDRLRAYYEDRSGTEWLIALPAWAMHRNQNQTPIYLSAQPYFDKGTLKKLLCITDRSQAVALSLRAEDAEQRLADQGETLLAGHMMRGAAHDLGNLLTVIQSQTEMIKRGAQDAPETAIAQLELATRDAAQITTRLLPPKNAKVERGPCDLVKLFKEIEPVMALTVGSSIAHHIEFEDQETEIFCTLDAHTLKNILLNLIVNARDAISVHGAVTLRLRPNLDRRQVSAHLARCHMIELEDNGAGIPTAMRDLVFKPGFTTKAERGGHGIGLSTLKQVLQDAGAEILLEQSPSGGTLVRLLLPAAKRVQGTKLINNGPQGVSPERMTDQRCALVVEPDNDVREFISLTLQAAGYVTLAVDNGLTAKDIFERKALYIDLVVCEMALPELASQDFLEAVFALKPEQRGLMISASAQSRVHQRISRKIKWETLAKPFSHAALKAEIEDAALVNAAVPRADQMLPRPW